MRGLAPGAPRRAGLAQRIRGRGSSCGARAHTGDGHGGGWHRPAVHDQIAPPGPAHVSTGMTGFRCRHSRHAPPGGAGSAVDPEIRARYDDLCTSLESCAAGATKNVCSWPRCRAASRRAVTRRPRCGPRVWDARFAMKVKGAGVAVGWRDSGQDIGSHGRRRSANRQVRHTTGRSPGSGSCGRSPPAEPPEP